MKTCPACAEEIKEAALVCKHCGTKQGIVEEDKFVSKAHKVAVAAPMSFAGAAVRLKILLVEDKPTWFRLGFTWWAFPLYLFAWWYLVFIWYLAFGLLVVPYRIIRRGQRNRKRQQLMHEELVSATQGSRPDSSRTLLKPFSPAGTAILVVIPIVVVLLSAS